MSRGAKGGTTSDGREGLQREVGGGGKLERDDNALGGMERIRFSMESWRERIWFGLEREGQGWVYHFNWIQFYITNGANYDPLIPFFHQLFFTRAGGEGFTTIFFTRAHGKGGYHYRF